MLQHHHHIEVKYNTIEEMRSVQFFGDFWTYYRWGGHWLTEHRGQYFNYPYCENRL